MPDFAALGPVLDRLSSRSMEDGRLIPEKWDGTDGAAHCRCTRTHPQQTVCTRLMADFATLDRYWQTVRRLRPIQIYGRLWFRLARAKVDASPAPALRTPSGAWVAPARRRPSLTAPEAFLFLNEHGALPECGVDDPKRDKLWRYNQHYFDDLNARRNNTAELARSAHRGLASSQCTGPRNG